LTFNCLNFPAIKK